MTLNVDDALVDQIIAAAREAGQKILEIYNSEFTVQAKDDKSPVTEADEASEEIIVRHLEAIDPSIPYIAEEAPTINSRLSLNDFFCSSRGALFQMPSKSK